MRVELEEGIGNRTRYLPAGFTGRSKSDELPLPRAKSYPMKLKQIQRVISAVNNCNNNPRG